MLKIKQKLIHNRILKDKLNWWENILDFIFYNKVSCFLRHVGRFLKRLPKYIGLAWTQETWDYEYLYDLIEMKLQELLKAQEEDTWHVEKGTKRRAKQIKICLAYLDRYRNCENYIEFPNEPLEFEPCKNGCSRLKENAARTRACKKANSFEKFNYDMFWKRFLQWHQHWWT